MIVMSKFFLKKNSYNKEILFLLFLYLTLIVSFFFGENSTGGAIKDYLNQKGISQKFSSNFFQTFYEYDNFSTRHSPILIIFLSFFEKINLPDFVIRLIHLHICLFLPLIFFKCLKLKFKEIDEKILLLLAALIFLSPTFRSLSIWPDSRLFGLIFFSISIFYFLKFNENKQIKFVFLNVFFLALSSYLSPNFSVFSIFFITKFISFYRFFFERNINNNLVKFYFSSPCILLHIYFRYKFFLKISSNRY